MAQSVVEGWFLLALTRNLTLEPEFKMNIQLQAGGYF
jgi:hypothetical protein